MVAGSSPADGASLESNMSFNLPDDVARCDGSGDDDEGWREGCERCLRRVAERPERTRMMPAPAIIVFDCEALIES